MSDYNFGYTPNNGNEEENTFDSSVLDNAIDNAVEEDTAGNTAHDYYGSESGHEDSSDEADEQDSSDEADEADEQEPTGRKKSKPSAQKRYLRRDLVTVAETALELSSKFSDEDSLLALASLAGIRGNDVSIADVAVKFGTMTKSDRNRLGKQVEFVQSVSRPNEGGWKHVIETIQSFSSLPTENKRGVFNLIAGAIDDESLTYTASMEDPDAVEKIINAVGDNGDIVLEFIRPVADSDILNR